MSINLVNCFNPNLNYKGNNNFEKYFSITDIKKKEEIINKIKEIDEYIKTENIDIKDLLFYFNKELLIFTIIKGIDINLQLNNGDNALINNIKNNLSNSVSDISFILITSNINLNIKGSNGSTFLHELIKKNNEECNIVGEFALSNNLNVNIDIDLQGENGKTPLMESILYNNKSIFNLLLKKNCNINVQDYFGNNVLIYCIFKNKLYYFKELCKHKNINFNIQGQNGYTPLIYAILLNKTKIAKEIINLSKYKEFNINLDCQDCYGNTPLIYSIKNNNNLITKMLLKESANINIKNIFGKSAKDIFSNKNLKEFNNLL